MVFKWKSWGSGEGELSRERKEGKKPEDEKRGEAGEPDQHKRDDKETLSPDTKKGENPLLPPFDAPIFKTSPVDRAKVQNPLLTNPYDDPILTEPFSTPISERSAEFRSSVATQAAEKLTAELSPLHAKYEFEATFLNECQKTGTHPFKDVTINEAENVFQNHMLDSASPAFYKTDINFYSGSREGQNSELIDVLTRENIPFDSQSATEDERIKSEFQKSRLGTISVVSHYLESHVGPVKKHHAEIWFSDATGATPQLLEAFPEYTSTDIIASINRHLSQIADEKK